MGHFYFKPFKPQYFFPNKLSDNPVFLNFYTPYSTGAKVIWWIWRNVPLFRNCFFIDDFADIPILDEISDFFGKDSIVAYNVGTQGEEQKITTISFLDNEFLFSKFASTLRAKVNVSNEAFILNSLQHLDFVPRILGVTQSSRFFVLRTEVLIGERWGKSKLVDEVLLRIIEINSLQIVSCRSFGGEVIKVFSHGDFCPWNLIICRGSIMVYDWEMAGHYPLGYDLFTFLFQSAFLLNPRLTIGNLLEENEQHIRYYFRSFGVEYWLKYLYEFASIKSSLERSKIDKRLFERYEDLMKYASET